LLPESAVTLKLKTRIIKRHADNTEEKCRK
jgi:hypothetical protein